MQKIQAAGFGDFGPCIPADTKASSPGLLYAEVSESSCALVLTLWPAFLLDNKLPLSLLWCLGAPDSDKDAGMECPVVPPGKEMPLTYFGGAEARLRLGLKSQASV